MEMDFTSSVLHTQIICKCEFYHLKTCGLRILNTCPTSSLETNGWHVLTRPDVIPQVTSLQTSCNYTVVIALNISTSTNGLPIKHIRRGKSPNAFWFCQSPVQRGDQVTGPVPQWLGKSKYEHEKLDRSTGLILSCAPRTVMTAFLDRVWAPPTWAFTKTLYSRRSWEIQSKPWRW